MAFDDHVLVGLCRVCVCVRDTMDVGHQQSLKRSSLWLFCANLITVAIAIWLFWDSVGYSSSAVAYFVVIAFGLLYSGFKCLYYFECWSQEKRMRFAWNRKYEWVPIFFMVIDILIIQTLFFIHILYINKISITEAFSNLDVHGWWLLAFLLVVAAGIVIFSVQSCYIHRANSVAMCKSPEEVAHARVPSQRMSTIPPSEERGGGGVSSGGISQTSSPTGSGYYYAGGATS